MRAYFRVALVAGAIFAATNCVTAIHAQAALLLEEPYGFFGTVNPTGHNAIYFARICAETPVRVRRCLPGETGSVISRYQGIDGYDWVAVPLVPYLYSVDSASDVPARVDRDTVMALRNRYHETHLMGLGEKLDEGNLVHGGWTQLVGAAYERRIYAFRFETTPEQDDALIARLNDRHNKSHFELLYNNCADFARIVLNTYFPRTFRRTIFPDAGITTPKQIAYKLEHYARKHPELHLTILEIPRIPGYQHLARSNNGVAEGLITTGYAVPLAIINPYLAGGIFVDYLVRGRFHLIPKNPPVMTPNDLYALTAPDQGPQNSLTAGTQALGTANPGVAPSHPTGMAKTSLLEDQGSHE
jgi:hypothetical protein